LFNWNFGRRKNEVTGKGGFLSREAPRKGLVGWDPLLVTLKDIETKAWRRHVSS
jgi:hypothetical protein